MRVLNSCAALFLMGFAILFGGNANAGEWSHVNLKSTEGVEIHLDFIANLLKDSSYKPTDIYTAEPVYVNVSSPRLKGTEKVRVALGNYEITSDGKNQYPEALYVVDLAWQGDHFSGDLRTAQVSRNQAVTGYHPLIIRRQGYAGRTRFEQQVSIVINGQWMDDPVSKTHDFRMEMYEAAKPTISNGQAQRVQDLDADDITVLKAEAVRKISGRGGYDPTRCVGGDCTLVHERRFQSPALHQINGIYDGNFMCHLLDVVTVTEVAALKNAEGIGFYYHGWNVEGRFIPREALVEIGQTKLKDGRPAVLHRFTGLANCWLGSASKSDRAAYSFKPYIAFRSRDGRIQQRNWDTAKNRIITMRKDKFDRSKELLAKP